jgi:hypothetical protein
MSATVKAAQKPRSAPRHAPAAESDAAKLRRARKMLADLLEETKALAQRAAENTARLKSFVQDQH